MPARLGTITHFCRGIVKLYSGVGVSLGGRSAEDGRGAWSQAGLWGGYSVLISGVGVSRDTRPRAPAIEVRLEHVVQHLLGGWEFVVYRGTSHTRKRTPLGPYRRPLPRVLGGSQGGGCFLMGKLPL